MRITGTLTNNINLFDKTTFNKKINNNTYSGRSALPMPTYAHYLSFCGGSSLNLKQSVENLDKLSIKNGARKGDKFPKDIHELALSIIETGNPANLRLIDIHKQKYSMLNDCYNLDDVKALFDEFSGVLSDSEINYQPDSFIARVKKGEIENFSKDEDVAMQLLKLYWAQGFSLNDLKNYSNGIDLYHTMKKLNIPTFDRDYAHVLKFSDKDYNARITSFMTQRRAESMERKIQTAQGEPVYIPGGPLSEMHKKHISEGLVNYYGLHPEKLVEMSNRQKEYFENNPEQKELLRDVALYAWNNTQEGRSIKKHLVKFFRKHNTEFNDEVLLGNKDKTSKPQQEVFAKFWKVNSWACKKSSQAFLQAWQFVRDMSISAPSSVSEYTISFAPKGLFKIFEDWCKKNKIPMTNAVILNSMRSELTDEQYNYIQKVFYKFIQDNPEEMSNLTSTMISALYSVRSDILSNNIDPQICSDENFLPVVVYCINNVIIPDGGSQIKPIVDISPNISMDSVLKLANNLSLIAMGSNQQKFIEYINAKIDKAYDIVKRAHVSSSAKAELRNFLYGNKTV